MAVAVNPASPAPSTPVVARNSFLTPRTWLVCTLAWLLFGVVLWIRDFLLVGLDAPGLQPGEFMLTVQSLVMWGFFSPFILTTAQLVEFEAGRRIRALVLHGALAIALSAVDVAADMILSMFTKLEEGTFGERFYRETFVNIFSYIVVAAVGYALVYYRRLAISKVNAVEMQRALAQARLDALARTLQPHFLFNSLNTIAALVRLSENKRALEAVVALSDLLRVVLKTGGAARVPLREEMQFTGQLVAVEQIRFEDRLEVRDDIEPGSEHLLVPALILQPLVENAIRHGIEEHGFGRVTIASHRTSEWLTLEVKVESHSDPSDPRIGGLGIGLDVTRGRLKCLYGEDRFALDLFVGPGHSSVTLRIPPEETVDDRADQDSHSGR